MGTTFGSTVNPQIIAVPLGPFSLHDLKEKTIGHINFTDWNRFLKILGAYTCSYISGSFTGTLNGVSGTTGTITYRIIGKMAFISITTAITGPSSATTFTITGVPSVLTTATSQTITSLAVEDSGTNTTTASLITGTSTTWTLRLGIAGGTSVWSATGTKGILAQNFSFPLD